MNIDQLVETIGNLLPPVRTIRGTSTGELDNKKAIASSVIFISWDRKMTDIWFRYENGSCQQPKDTFRVNPENGFQNFRPRGEQNTEQKPLGLLRSGFPTKLEIEKHVHLNVVMTLPMESSQFSLRRDENGAVIRYSGTYELVLIWAVRYSEYGTNHFFDIVGVIRALRLYRYYYSKILAFGKSCRANHQSLLCKRNRRILAREDRNLLAVANGKAGKAVPEVFTYQPASAFSCGVIMIYHSDSVFVPVQL